MISLFSKVVGQWDFHLNFVTFFESSFCLGYPWMTSVCYRDNFENFKKFRFQSKWFSTSYSFLCIYWSIFTFVIISYISKKKYWILMYHVRCLFKVSKKRKKNSITWIPLGHSLLFLISLIILIFHSSSNFII